MNTKNENKNTNLGFIHNIFIGVSVMGGLVVYWNHNKTNVMNMEKYFNKKLKTENMLTIKLQPNNSIAYVYPPNKNYYYVVKHQSRTGSTDFKILDSKTISVKDDIQIVNDTLVKDWNILHFPLNNKVGSLDNILKNAMSNTQVCERESEDIFEKYFNKNYINKKQNLLFVVEDIPITTKNEFEPLTNKLLHMVEKKNKKFPDSTKVIITSNEKHSEKLLEQIYGSMFFRKINYPLISYKDGENIKQQSLNKDVLFITKKHKNNIKVKSFVMKKNIQRLKCRKRLQFKSLRYKSTPFFLMLAFCLLFQGKD